MQHINILKSHILVNQMWLNQRYIEDLCQSSTDFLDESARLKCGKAKIVLHDQMHKHTYLLPTMNVFGLGIQRNRLGIRVTINSTLLTTFYLVLNSKSIHSTLKCIQILILILIKCEKAKIVLHDQMHKYTYGWQLDRVGYI